MTTDYMPCGRCLKPMVAASHMVYPVTWMGKPVCASCAAEIKRQTDTSHQWTQNR